MKSSLKQALRNKHSRHQLSGQQLAALRQKITAQPDTRQAATARLKLAGLFSIILLTALLLPRIDSMNRTGMAQQIAEEVIKNHFNQKPLEVHTNNIDGLNRYFTQVHFLLRPSREVAEFSSHLLGGRYCSLQGVTAAQLRLRASVNQKVDTLYQTEYRPDIFGPLPDIDHQQMPLVAWARGIRVRIWVEKGILFAVTDVAATGQ